MADVDRKRVEEVLALAGLDADFAERGITLESYMTDRLTEDGIDLRQKLLVAPHLRDMPVLQKHDPVRKLCAGKTVGIAGLGVPQ